ncbi:MAG: rhomboid family intramembrane serine protease [Myxococcota bacterium]|nr:rhomboid family intramembrane serine protease [Myxococcales bacterium]
MSMPPDPERVAGAAEAASPPAAGDGDAAGLDAAGGTRRIRLARSGAVELLPHGFRVIEPRGLKRSPTHLYDTITHVHDGASLLLIGTTAGLITLRHTDFPDPKTGPAALRSALLERVAAQPDGARQLAEMERLEAMGDERRGCWAVWTVSALCLLVTALQLREPELEQMGAFMPELFLRGETWRAVTAHFLHGLSPAPRFVSWLLGGLPWLPFHLAVNVGGLLVLGHLVERPLGTTRTILVLGASAVGTLAGILYSGHVEVIGASGLVAGLAGALLALELHDPAAVPSYWRLPRRLFFGALILQFVVVDQIFDRYVAGGAHLGGFAGGYVGAWLIGRVSGNALVPEPRLRLAAIGVVLVGVGGLLGILPLARHEPAALERHAMRLLDTPAALYLNVHENAAAWFIATEGEATPEALDLAIALADRAVTSTQRLHPGHLDTLAEALFQSGDALGAVLTIEEAMRLAPFEPYYFEQRRRFLGERHPDDRPPPPGTRAPDEDDGLPIDPNAPRVVV